MQVEVPLTPSVKSLRRVAVGAAALTALMALGAPAVLGGANQQQKYPAASPDSVEGFPDLEGALRETEGCLGVETAMTASGKQVIFAWFEDKEAALRWFWDETHQGAMQMFFGDAPEEEPMHEIPDEVGPILAIASITMAAEPQHAETSLPISQIAIELYTPLSGGISIGGRFAPESLVVPKRRVVVEED